MSCDENSESLELKSQKHSKRVRFADDIKHVYEYEHNEDVQNENFVSSNSKSLEPKNFPLKESAENMKNAANTLETSSSLPEYRSDNDELSGGNKLLILTVDFNKDSPPAEYSNNNSGMLDLLIRETQNMTLSSPNWRKRKSLSLPLETISMCSSCDTNSPKNALQLAKQPVKKNCNVSHNTQKRSFEGMFIKTQTSQINVWLKNYQEINSAVDLRSAVFNAWNKVKNENTSVKNASFVPEVKEIINTSPKTAVRKFENQKKKKDTEKSEMDIPPKTAIRNFQNKTNTSLKVSKRNAANFSFQEFDPLPQKKKEDIEESKMAFQAWKKKKDDLLNQQITQKFIKEEKKRMDSLINERMRKSDAESAYFAWISHKARVVKMEKKKINWLLEKENEKLYEKIKRNEEAAETYCKWLRSKLFSEKNNYHKVTEDKPPWTPPGKIISLI